MKKTLISDLMAAAFAPSRIIPSENAGRRYHELVDPLTADKRGRIIPAYGVRLYVLDLTTARAAVPLGLKGDVWFCDYNSTGVATIQNNNTSEGAMPALALAGLGNMPFDDLFITHAAQAGLVLNLWVGYGADFIAPTSAIATIGSITNAVKIKDSSGNTIDSISSTALMALATRNLVVVEGGDTYGASFSSSGALTANTPQAVLAAASNTNGAIVHRARGFSQNATGMPGYSFLEKATAPASSTDGNILAGGIAGAILASIWLANATQEKPSRIAAGRRLDWIVSITETVGQRSALWTVL